MVAKKNFIFAFLTLLILSPQIMLSESKTGKPKTIPTGEIVNETKNPIWVAYTGIMPHYEWSKIEPAKTFNFEFSYNDPVDQYSHEFLKKLILIKKDPNELKASDTVYICALFKTPKRYETAYIRFTPKEEFRNQLGSSWSHKTKSGYSTEKNLLTSDIKTIKKRFEELFSYLFPAPKKQLPPIPSKN